jgi:hypothetical protein
VCETHFLCRHQLRVGKESDLGAQSELVVGEISKLPKLLPIIGPGVDFFAFSAGEGYRGDLASFPRGIIAHHRQDAAVVESVPGQKGEVAFQSFPIIFTAPEGSEE